MSIADKINDISDQVLEIEQSYEALKLDHAKLLEEVNHLRNRDPADDQRVKELLDALEENIADREKLIGNGPKIQRSINAYRALRT